MFIIENGKIQGNKTLNVGKNRIINLQFQSDFAFADGDKLSLLMGGIIEVENYAFTQNGCFRFCRVDITPLLEYESKNIMLVISKNGNQIFTDSITLYAEYNGGGSSGGGETDLSNYMGGVSISDANSNNIIKKYGDDITVGNQQNKTYIKGQNIVFGGYIQAKRESKGFNKQILRDGVATNDLLAMDNTYYEELSDGVIFLSTDEWRVKRFIVESDSLTITFPYTPNEDLIYTTELWVQPKQEITSINIENGIEVVNTIPTTLAYSEGITHVFVLRTYRYIDQFGEWFDTVTLSYAYSFTDKGTQNDTL